MQVGGPRRRLSPVDGEGRRGQGSSSAPRTRRRPSDPARRERVCQSAAASATPKCRPAHPRARAGSRCRRICGSTRNAPEWICVPMPELFKTSFQSAEEPEGTCSVPSSRTKLPRRMLDAAAVDDLALRLELFAADAVQTFVIRLRRRHPGWRDRIKLDQLRHPRGGDWQTRSIRIQMSMRAIPVASRSSRSDRASSRRSHCSPSVASGKRLGERLESPSGRSRPSPSGNRTRSPFQPSAIALDGASAPTFSRACPKVGVTVGVVDLPLYEVVGRHAPRGSRLVRGRPGGGCAFHLISAGRALQRKNPGADVPRCAALTRSRKMISTRQSPFPDRATSAPSSLPWDSACATPGKIRAHT